MTNSCTAPIWFYIMNVEGITGGLCSSGMLHSMYW